mmetsp:Transcript_108813/g.249622  ORF Transcript_108813/g.249622 Transcript_108813/m.249622 type:complete len:219 (-) Transcript_108813:119-775(-)
MVAVCAVRVWIIFVWTVHASVEGWTGARVASWVPSKKPVQHSWVPDSLRRIGIEDRTLGMLGLLALLSAAALLHADVKAASDPLGCAISQADNLHNCDDWGLTPLHFAAYSGSVETASMLLVKGTSLHLDAWDQSPLHCAAARGHSDVLQVLVDHVVSLGLPLDQQDASGDTALVLAGRSGCASAVDVLLRAGAGAATPEEELPPLVVRQLMIHVLGC